MKLLMFSVFDSKAGAYLRPWFAETMGLALRTFGDAVMASDSPFFQHPEDYTLFHVGSFDQGSGVLEPEDPRAISTALSVRSGRENAQLRVVGAS